MSSLNIKSVLLLDGIDKICSDKLSEAGIAVTVKAKLSKDELLQEIKNYDAVVVRSATKVTAEVLAAAAAGPRLQLVGRAGTGTDNIDVEAATKMGVIVMNTPGGNTLSAAEHTCALILSLCRFLPQACASLKEGAWDRKKYMGSELSGKTLAVVGLGRIGREVAKRMQSFDMTVIGYDPFVSAEVAAQWDIEALELEEIWPRADYITVHTPLMPHTRNLVGERVLTQCCKPGVKIINVARGGIVDETALLAALESGRCGGAGLDVYINEPPTDLKLCQHPKVVCTPHLGASTIEAQQRVAQEIADQIVTGNAGGPLVGLVNAQALAAAGSTSAQPWVTLATALGQVAAALLPQATTTTVTIQCYGGQVAPLSRALESGVLVGMLKTTGHGFANLVNSTLLAVENGITLQKSSSTDRPLLLPSAVSQCIVVTVGTTAGTYPLIGSVSNCQSALYTIKDCMWESGLPLSQTLLLFRAPVGEPESTLVSLGAAVAGKGGRLLSLVSSGLGSADQYYAIRMEGDVPIPAAMTAGAKFLAKVMF